jgi:hypothetical protein
MRLSDFRYLFTRPYAEFTILANGVRLYLLSIAVTANVTETSAPAGSIAITSNATGRGTPFYSDGSKWQAFVTGVTTKASGAEVNTGTDDGKFVTAKAIADSTIAKAKASGAETNTGTDDVKFVTAKALKDADIAKAAGTPVSLDVFYFRTAAGVVKSITLADLATAIDGELNP